MIHGTCSRVSAAVPSHSNARQRSTRDWPTRARADGPSRAPREKNSKQFELCAWPLGHISEYDPFACTHVARKSRHRRRTGRADTLHHRQGDRWPDSGPHSQAGPINALVCKANEGQAKQGRPTQPGNRAATQTSPVNIGKEKPQGTRRRARRVPPRTATHQGESSQQAPGDENSAAEGCPGQDFGGNEGVTIPPMNVIHLAGFCLVW